MFLPLGDEPNPRGTPVVTWTLIAVNTAVFLLVTLPLSRVGPALDDPALFDYVRAVAPQVGSRSALEALLRQVSAYDLVVFAHGFRPADPSALALASSMFLHGGFMHLAGNMLFLWISATTSSIGWGAGAIWPPISARASSRPSPTRP